MAESFSHKFGQIIGNLLELALQPEIKKFARKHKLYFDKQGVRKARTGQKVSWTDENNNKHNLDIVLERGGTENKIGIPVAFIESAWRRGTRHSKNKVQEIQAAVNPIVFKHKSTVCFKGAILGGDFTKPSIQQLESDNYSVLYFPTDLFVKTFRKFNLDIISTDTTLESEYKRRIDLWENFQKKEELFKELLKSNRKAVKEFLNSLSGAVSRYIEKVILIPLHGNESTAKNITDAIKYLKNYSEDKQKYPLLKYEVIIRYNTGDRIDATFKDKKDTIKFLEAYL